MYSGINDVDGAPIFLDISTKKYTIMNLDYRCRNSDQTGQNIEKSFLFLTKKNPMGKE